MYRDGNSYMSIAPDFVNHLLRKNLGLLFMSVIFGVCSGALCIVLIHEINTSLNGTSSATNSLANSGRFSLALLTCLATAFLSQHFLNLLGRDVLLYLRSYIANSVIRRPLPEIELIGAPRINLALIQDAQTISSAIQTIPHFVINSAVLVVGLSYLAVLSIKVFILASTLLIVGVFVHRQITLRTTDLLKHASAQNEDLFQNFRTLTDAIKELKLNRPRRHDFLLHDLELNGRASAKSNQKALTLFSVATQWGNFILFFLIGVIAFSGTTFIGIESSLISAAAVTIIYLLNPISILLNTISSFERMKIAVTRIASLQDRIESVSPDCSAEGSTNAEHDLLKSIELSSIQFQYTGESNEGFRLGPINLTIKPGEITFIVGGNGGGKSTLLKVLTGLYPPTSGVLTWNEKQIKNPVQREDYRQLFAAVFYDFHLFKRIPKSASMLSSSLIETYLKQLQLIGKVAIADGSFTTTELSQGQKKRLALISAYMENRPIYVFDEWAADQDPCFKDVFYHHILPALKNQGKAVVAITHDEKYFGIADHLLRLEDGKIAPH